MKKISKSNYSASKERALRELSETLAKAGFTVRREKLKSGFGWRVQSGSCVASGDRMIFVDSKLSQDEQISFLADRLRVLGSNEEPFSH